MDTTEFPTTFDQNRSRRYFLSLKGAKYFFVASLLMAVAFLVSLYDASGECFVSFLCVCYSLIIGFVFANRFSHYNMISLRWNNNYL